MDAFSGSGLKRKFDDVDVGSSVSNSDDEMSSSDSADSCDSLNPPTTASFTPTSILKRQKQLRRKNVRFDQVTVYYFARRQGFTSVPSQGGSSLGMAQRHNSVRSYTLCEFAQEQEVNHREILREHLKEEKLHAKKMKLTKNGTVESVEADGLTLDDVSDEDIDVENVEVDDYFFLQPLPTKRRRALLRASGVHRIDAEEKQELRAIRLSREECGCDCRLYCDPEACACSQAGIKCQVDRMSFPSYLNSGPLVYYQVEQRPVVGVKAESGSEEGPASFPKEKDLSVFSLPVTSLVACGPSASAALCKPEVGKTSSLNKLLPEDCGLKEPESEDLHPSWSPSSLPFRTDNEEGCGVQNSQQSEDRTSEDSALELPLAV